MRSALLRNSIYNQILSYFEPLTSSYAQILISKAKFNVLYRGVYLSRSIRPNKHPKIKCQIWSKARLLPFLPFLLMRGKFKRRNPGWGVVCNLFLFKFRWNLKEGCTLYKLESKILQLEPITQPTPQNVVLLATSKFHGAKACAFHQIWQ